MVKNKFDFLMETITDNRSISIFGFNDFIKGAINIINKDFNIMAIYDNDINKSGIIYKNIKVYYFNSLNVEDIVLPILIFTTKESYFQISKQLSELNLLENKDFFYFQEYISIYYWKYKKQLISTNIDTAITTKCTLKCKNCNMFIPYYDIGMDLELSIIKKNIDDIFNNFDYVFNFVFLGGEPFIYKELLQLLEYISKYKKHIGEVSIVTNGTILPNNDILNIVKENDIHIQISNYNVSENYISKLKKLESILITNGINYNINNHLSWKDFVFPRKGFHLESDNIIKHMLNCNPVFKGVTESRFYFCHIVWSAVKSGLIKHNSNDSIDISQKLNDNEKLNLLKFSLGLFDAKYISLCEFCAGCGTDNKLFIKAGLQI